MHLHIAYFPGTRESEQGTEVVAGHVTLGQFGSLDLQWRL